MVVRRPTLLVFAAGFAVLLVALFAASAVARDKNRDKLPDGWEKRYKLSLKIKQTHRDPDRDGLDNLNEYKNGTNPRNPDTDGDGVDDGTEVQFGLNPTNADSDGDGNPDGQATLGRIVSFDGTTLRIKQAGGGQISGIVNDDTDIECDKVYPPGMEQYDGLCFPSDLLPGVQVSDAKLNPDGTFDEVDLVGVGSGEGAD